MSNAADLARVFAEVYGPEGPYEIGMTNYFGRPVRYIKNGPKTLLDLYEFGSNFEEEIFLVLDNERLTYTQTFERVAALGWYLKEVLFVKKGDRVAIAMRNYPEWIISFMAITSIGAIAVPMNGWWIGHEIEYAVNDSGSTVFIGDQERVDRLAIVLSKFHSPPTIVCIRSTKPLPPGSAKYEDILKLGAGKAMPQVEVNVDDDATIFYTSGTTGYPKGVCSTHGNILQALMGYVSLGEVGKRLNLTPPATDEPIQESILLPIPLFHNTGSHAVFLISFFMGRKVVLMLKWDAKKALELIEREKVTSFTGVPTMSWEMMQHPDFSKYNTSSLKSVAGGGAATAPTMVRAISNKFKGSMPAQGYGLTETNAFTCINMGDNYLRKPSSCGRPLATSEVKVVDDNDKEVPIGQPGELLIRGPGVMRCYWNKPEDTSKVISPDGWFRSGDIATVDEEGYVYIVDRSKDLVIRGGENISCVEVENAAYEFPGIMECAVFGLPDVRLGEEVCIAIYPKQGHKINLDELKQHLTKILATYKIPSKYFILKEQLPRGATGKIVKRTLKEEIVKQLKTSKL